MFEYGRLFIVIEPDGRGDFEITASDKEPEHRPGLQYLKTVKRDSCLNPIMVYGVNVHIGDIDFDKMDMVYWRFYQVLGLRSKWA